MKSRGFTLVELVMVITVLSVIVIIAVPAVTTIINNSKENAQKTQEKVIINAAKNYFSSPDHSLEITSLDASGTCVTVATLQDEGLLPISNDASSSCTTGLYDPKTKECILGTSGVKVTFSNNKYKYSVIDTCSS